jgi:hypothetical protein
MEATLRPRTRRISLDFMGDDWQEAYFDARFMTWAEAKELRSSFEKIKNDTDRIMEESHTVVKNCFVSGKGVAADGSLVDMTIEHVETLDMDTVLTIYHQLMGAPSPKASTPSASTSTDGQSNHRT